MEGVNEKPILNYSTKFLFSLIFLFLSNSISVAQEEIKEEIILKEQVLDESDGISIPMPFYGRIYSEIPCWHGTGWVCGWIKKHRAAGSQVWDTGCWNVPCDQSCFQGAGQSDGYTFYNVPQGTEFVVEVERSINGICYDVSLIYTGGTNNLYYIRAFDVQISEWVTIGEFSFTETTPLGCDNLDPCEYNESPILKYEEPKEEGYNETYACSTSCAGGQLAGFKPVSWHLPQGYEWNLNTCANPVTGDVRYTYSLTNAGQTLNEIPITYIIDYCEENCIPSKIYIEDEDDLIAKLEDKNDPIPEDDYCTLYSDICKHYGFPFANYRYVFKEMIQYHEERHLNNYQDWLNFNKAKFLDDAIKEVEVTCSLYVNDPSGTRQNAELRISNSISAYIEKGHNDFDAVEDISYSDLAIQLSPDILRMAIKYYSVFNTWHNNNAQHVQCPPIDACTGIKAFIN